MTAHGKITTNKLRPGDIVLYAASYNGEHWIQATRKDHGTYAGRVESIRAEMERERGTRRAQRWYLVTLARAPFDQTGEHVVTVKCSPASTWWLAAASRKWRTFLGLPELGSTIKSATPTDQG
jgi:hypothetical protein